jgi:hypothetical protein
MRPKTNTDHSASAATTKAEIRAKEEAAEAEAAEPKNAQVRGGSTQRWEHAHHAQRSHP